MRQRLVDQMDEGCRGAPRDTVRLRPTESFADLDVLVSEPVDLPLRALEGPRAEA